MASFAKIAAIFSLTQIPLAIIEGILTVVFVNVVIEYGGEIVQSPGKGELNHE